jgi:thimet oligopeptidase
MVKLDPLFQSEMKIFRSMKQEIEKVSEKDSEIKAWDYRFYMNLREEKEFMVDHELVKQYFPLQKVTEGLLEIYQHLLALKFVEVTNPKTWHPEVRLFEVYDAKNPKEFVGNFYLDLHPREGKYGHAAVFGLQPSFGFGDSSPESRKQYPVAAMVANFTKPGKEKPSLLNHQEVVTYFHEFGHVVHQICSKTKYSRFSGTRVERDFVEAPSQMLENWCWEKESLLKMSGHYQTGAPLPEHILEKLVAAKNANAGIFNFRQMFFGIFDQTIHSMSSANTEQVYNSLMHKVFQVPPSPGTNGSASFGHLAGGYDATYYGYLWSEVYSADMFDSKFRGNVLDQKSGIEYREKILLVGGTRDAIDSLKDFLGREPNSNAFMKSKGIFKE